MLRGVRSAAGWVGKAAELREVLAPGRAVGVGFGFLAVQALCWIEWMGPLKQALVETQKAYVLTSFYVLTGIHALHVIGGLVPLGVITINAFRGAYGPGDHAGIGYCATYWHFLDGVWLILFATLMIGSHV